MRLPFISFTPTVNSHRSSTLRRVWRYGPLAAWLGFIWVASTGEFSAGNTSLIVRPLVLWIYPNATEAELASIHFLTRKAAHFCEYAVLAFLARRAFITSGSEWVRRHWFQLGLALVVVNSLLDELHQAFVPSRTGSIYDSAIDVLGGLTVLAILKMRDNRRPPRSTND